MEKLELKNFTLEGAIKEYKKYNDEITGIISAINRIIENNNIDEEDYNKFKDVRSFVILYIKMGHYKSTQCKLVSDLVNNIFVDNIKAIDDLDIYSKSSDKYNMLIKQIIESAFPQSTLIKGLNNLLDFYESVEGVPEFYEETFDLFNEDPIISRLPVGFNMPIFIKTLSFVECDNEKIRLIRDEIKDIKLKSIGYDSLYSAEEAETLVRDLEKYISVLESYSDEPTKVMSSDSAQDYDVSIEPNQQDFEVEVSDHPSVRNKDHTMMRKVLALFYILNEVSDGLFDDGNKMALARFFSFLTGNNESNIYKGFAKMHEGLDNPNSSRRRDFEFVINELEKIGLGAIAEKVKNDME